MEELTKIADELGIEKLMGKAQEMLDSQKQKERWKLIGGVAEKAFEDAISNLDFDFEIENPDLGKDFEIIVSAKGYSIEIKSVAEGKENVRMSILQGRTASIEKDSYALCVLTRPDNNGVVDKEYFINHSRFVTDIGYQVGDKVKKWDEGLRNLESNDAIKVLLDDKKESVYVNRSIWRGGISFAEFVVILKKYFAQNEAN